MPVRSRAGALPRAVRSAVPALLLLPLLGAAPPGARAADPAGRLQDVFTSAAAEYGVPPSVLLGVAYLQSRWDGHGGAPSVTGGYGPMHLTDARTALERSARPRHDDPAGDPRGDQARPAAVRPGPADLAPDPRRLPDRLTTLPRAAALTGLAAGTLRGDPAANVRGGAALLADAQRRLGRPAGGDPADWYGAVARFSGATDRAGAFAYADEVFTVIRQGAARTTDSGQRVTLAARAVPRPEAGARTPDPSRAECPPDLSCTWLPAPYQELGDGDYGNHDLADRPRDQRVDFIVVHDTETTWDRTLKLVADPAYVSWHYTIRSTDGQIAQHVRTKDVGWHAGNWYVNARSVGIEHEGFLAEPDAWYTEAMYRSSARLVAYLAGEFQVPLDRAHIIGHDNVPGATAKSVPGMHTDPGPFWDWRHYFELLGAPFEAAPDASGALVTVLPGYDANRPEFLGCSEPGVPCPAHGSGALRVRTEPRDDAPLVPDAGLRPDGGATTAGVNDTGARLSTGQRYAVAERSGEWRAVWYLGRKGWFRDPAERGVTVPSRGVVVTPKPGLVDVPVYGRAYPEAAAYPSEVPVQPLSPLPYRLGAGQRYVSGGEVRGEFFHAPSFDTGKHRVVRGTEGYHLIQFGHRVAYVRTADVVVREAG
ncbi:N-acetylmuramoyl-L-alanine amidase [Streptomyces uncialis]|uniref:N-acetylmuramoyl-L-alanine amidase n=1 Tax=Streptomyces uncialis TaxID=1048205 RepID=UPI00378C91F6